MTAKERETLMSYLRSSYMEMMKELSYSQLYNSNRFPQVSKQLAVTKSKFLTLSALARELNIPNPYELKNWEIQITEDETIGDGR